MNAKIRMDSEAVIERLRTDGFILVEDAVDAPTLSITRRKLDELQRLDVEEFGTDTLLAMGEYGTLRFPMVRDRFFLTLIDLPTVMPLVEARLGPNCILHLQNGIVMFPSRRHQQAAFHQDFRPWLNGADVSLNVFLFVDAFTAENGATTVAPGSHLLERRPSDVELARTAVQLPGAAGTALVFDSRLWHRGGANSTSKPRRALNMQYTSAFIRQQVDYAHCLSEDEYATFPDRVQQLLGRYVRLPKSAAEFRVRPEERLHRSGQF
jgi:ectoine hydroxylase-related dioxygenase (phytanoyl-CoA dioxygenase family)